MALARLFPNSNLPKKSINVSLIDSNQIIFSNRHYSELNSKINLYPQFKPESIEYDNELHFVVKANNWSVWGNQGCVLTDKNYVFSDVSSEFNSVKNSIFQQYKIIKYTYIDETAAVIAASGADVYYHWMVDILPRISLLKDANVFNDISKFIINYTDLPYQKETLNTLGIKEERLIKTNDHWKSHYKAKILLVPSFASKVNVVSLYSINFLRKTFLNTNDDKFFYANIYIKRKYSRKIVNEYEVETLLKQYGYVTLTLENYSVNKQAFLFNNATKIVGVHGGGFTNIIFCKQHTKIIEIFSPNWINLCYWTIAAQLNLEYNSIICKNSKSNLMMDEKYKAVDVEIDLEELEKML